MYTTGIYYLVNSKEKEINRDKTEFTTVMHKAVSNMLVAWSLTYKCVMLSSLSLQNKSVVSL